MEVGPPTVLDQKMQTDSDTEKLFQNPNAKGQGLKKTTVTTKQSFHGAFALLCPKFALNVLLLGAIIYIISCIVCPHQIKAGRIISLSTTVTKPQNQSASNKSQLSGQWQSVRMRVTGYCACPKCCGSYSDGITASGHRITAGDAFIAADRKYPFGTEMVIDGYNNAKPVKVLDRGGAIYGNRLDAFFSSHEQALKWGVRYLNVKVLQN